MPLYEFACEACRKRFEEFTAVGARPPCPSCGADEVRRVYHAPGRLKLQLRGKAARDSEARRAEREAQRAERLEQVRKARARGELPP